MCYYGNVTATRPSVLPHPLWVILPMNISLILKSCVCVRAHVCMHACVCVCILELRITKVAQILKIQRETYTCPKLVGVVKYIWQNAAVGAISLLSKPTPYLWYTLTTAAKLNIRSSSHHSLTAPHVPYPVPSTRLPFNFNPYNSLWSTIISTSQEETSICEVNCLVQGHITIKGWGCIQLRLACTFNNFIWLEPVK